MSRHMTVLDGTRHKFFLHQQRRDPVTKEPFRPGDRVVLCAADGSAFLEDSWISIGEKHCDQRETLPSIPVEDEPIIFSSQRSSHQVLDPDIFQYASTPERDIQDDTMPEEEAAPENETSREDHSELRDEASSEYNIAPDDNVSSQSEPIWLREIPISLREIPVRLRNIIEL